MDCRQFFMDHAVLQRNREDLSDHPVSGSCRTCGRVMMSVYHNGQIFNRLENVEIGSAANGKFSGRIAGLPAGGPYTVELSIGKGGEKKCYKDILVGDLWLLAGQSNMADSGFMPSCSEPDPMVHAFYMTDNWGVAEDPLHDTAHAVAPVHGGNPANPYGKRLRGTGPGLPFGLAMYKKSGVPQGLIALAHGGTSLAQWDPAQKRLCGHSLYGAFYERLQWLGGRVAGLLWYQGCNETTAQENTENYDRLTRRLFKAFRRDCQDPELPIVFVQLGSYIGRENDPLPQHRWISVRNDQYRIGRTLKRAVCVPAIDLELDDSIHLSNRAVTILGGRMADAMHLLVSENRNDQIFVKKISCRNEPLLNCAKLRIEFGNVQGSLQSSGGLPCGFAAVDKQGKLAAKAINTRLSGNTAEVLTTVPYMLFADEYMISYGAETQPCGNITDEAGRSLPCFMQKLPGRRGDFTSILQQALRSAAVYTDDRLEALTVPQELKWEMAPFNTFYLPCPREVGELDRKPKVYCYKFKVRAEDDTNTELLMGADAPFVLYCDGKEFCRQQATNPVVLDEFVYPCRLSGGVHEFICVFSSNSGLGWGICCRFRKLKNEPAVEFVPVCEF